MLPNFNSDLAKEINSLRTNPKKYSEKVKSYTKYFKGKILKLPGTNAGIKTEEGVNAYNETINFLLKQPPIEPLELSKGMCKIASDLLYEVQNLDPNDINSIDMEKIISKYGNFYGNFARAIDYGGENAEQVMVNLLVSDGDPSRSQRESLLSNDLRKVGVANGKHDFYRHCSVIVSCTKFENTKDKNDFVDFENYNDYNKDDVNKKKEGEELIGNVTEIIFDVIKKVFKKYDKNTPFKDKIIDDLIFDYNDDNKDDVNKKKEIKNEKKKEKINEKIGNKYISVSKSEKIVTEDGVKKKVIRIERFLEDGTKEVETTKETVED